MALECRNGFLIIFSIGQSRRTTHGGADQLRQSRGRGTVHKRNRTLMLTLYRKDLKKLPKASPGTPQVLWTRPGPLWPSSCRHKAQYSLNRSATAKKGAINRLAISQLVHHQEEEHLTVWPVLAGVIPRLRCHAATAESQARTYKTTVPAKEAPPARAPLETFWCGKGKAEAREEKATITGNPWPLHPHFHSHVPAVLANWRLQQSVHIVLQVVPVGLLPPLSFRFLDVALALSSVSPVGMLPSSSSWPSSSCSAFHLRKLSIMML